MAALTMLNGGMAQVIAVPAERVFPLPDTVSFEAGAGLLFNDLTVHFALTERGRLATGETVLVHGAAGVSAPRRCGWRPPSAPPGPSRWSARRTKPTSPGRPAPPMW
ncbi:quinone reductase [Mycobacterium xenopi 4042]|uniref:Quinone reductase n=1 Tax=Mycobacterium xenopi 4042 TaxID=1299334 RepID=X7YIG2_MYCXE|nr:quinone reductase [Mycobacterium xenopi 4042]